MYIDATVEGVTSKDYKFLKDAYYGKGGFATGRYLLKFGREGASDFLNRQSCAYYPNYIKPCLNSQVDPIFRSFPVREAAVPSQIWDEFLKNVDGRGTPMDRFMKKAAVAAKLYGCVFIVVDNDLSQAVSLDRVIKERLYPYLYIVYPTQVEDYAVDKFGRLIYFRYQDTFNRADAVQGHRQITESWSWSLDKWTKNSEGVTFEGVNELGSIPVIPLMGAQEDQDEPLFPVSDFYQVACLNRAVYNACSELRTRNRGQAFSVLTYQIPEEDDPKDYQDPKTGRSLIDTGVNAMLMYKAGTGKPEYITPAQAPSDMLQAEISFLISEIYRMSERANVTGVEKANSGVSKEWDNQAMMQGLAEFAKSLETAEINIAKVFGAYIGTDLQVDVRYNDDFGVTDVTAELDRVTKALSLNIGGLFDIEVRKLIARTMLNDADDSIIEDVIKDIETTATADGDEDYTGD